LAKSTLEVDEIEEIGSNTVNIIEHLYDEYEYAVSITGHITQWCKVTIGVRQGCLLEPTLFNVFIEFVMDELEILQTTFF